MHKRIFFRYFNACAWLVLLTIFILGIATTTVFTLREIGSQDEKMERAARQVASMLEGVPMNYNALVGSVMEGSIETVKQTIDADVVIINQRTEIVQSTIENQSTVELPKAAVETVMNGSVYRRQSVFVREHGEAYTVGVPIRGMDGDVTGGVFVTARQVRVNSVAWGVLLPFTFCGISVMALAFIILYFITRRMTRPLNEMAVAARAYAKGDFSKRITVSPDAELGALAMTFNQMADGIDQLETVRRGFIADVSHELRTPMTTIGGFIDGILDGVIPAEQQEKYLLIVSEEVKRLTRMVNSLLDVAKIQSGEVTYQMLPFDITEPVRRVALTMEERVRERKISLVLQIPEDALYVLGDQDAIYRVVYNLVDNAVKFTPDEGVITVTVLPQANKAFVSVKNTGDGIPEAEVGKIFERFYKTDKSRGSNRKGVGLGLYMVKSIMEAHGEDMYVTSQVGAFAEFTFSLKLADDEEDLWKKTKI